jgi:glutathione S-transferase
MRARLSLLLAEQTVRLRDIVLTDKPSEMLAASSKGTVPLLVFEQGKVIEESLDIMLWALHLNDPQNLLYADNPETLPLMLELINTNDNEFISQLKKYKCAARYKDDDEAYHRQHCEQFILHLEQRLTTHRYFMGDTLSLADYAILPFIRQFAKVDRKWYLSAPYPNLQRWLNQHLQSPLYTKALAKYPRWSQDNQDTLFAAQ